MIDTYLLIYYGVKLTKTHIAFVRNMNNKLMVSEL